MKSLLAILAIGLAVTMTPAMSAEPVADMKAPAKWAPNKKTMEKDGRFHYTHVKKEKMACADCHSDASRDVLFLRNTEAPPATLGAHVDRAECIGCHQGKRKPTWYGAKPG